MVLPQWVIQLLPLIGVVVGTLLTAGTGSLTLWRTNKHQRELAQLDDQRKLRDARLRRLEDLYTTEGYTALRLQLMHEALFPFTFDGEDSKVVAERQAGAAEQDHKLAGLTDAFMRACGASLAPGGCCHR